MVGNWTQANIFIITLNKYTTTPRNFYNTINNPAMKLITNMEQIEPTEGRRTLGVFFGKQIRHGIAKTAEYKWKINHSKLSKHAKQKSTNMILNSQIQYPGMATLCTCKDLKKIDRPVICYKSTALGINEHFPRALLYDHPKVIYQNGRNS